MNIDFEGARVAELALDYTLRVKCEPLGAFMIEVPVTLERDGTTRVLPVGDADLTGEFALDDLVGRQIVAAHATDDGVLTLEFEENIRITAAVDPDHESWNLWVPSGAVYNAGPGERTFYAPQHPSVGHRRRP
jgi:hypothetical protein